MGQGALGCQGSDARGPIPKNAKIWEVAKNLSELESGNKEILA